jgi:hypothetical protein
MIFRSRRRSNGLAGYLETESEADQHEPASRSSLTPRGVLAGVLVVCALALIAATAFGWDRGGDPGPQAKAATQAGLVQDLADALPSATQQSSPPSSPSAAATAEPAADARSDCRALLSAESATIGRAVDALAQWRVHVRAMNKLVGGQITLAQANAFWNSTRVGAARRVARFERAEQQFHAAFDNSGCSGEVPARCQEAAQARGATLFAAQTAVGTWKHHVMDMEMLRMGHLSPAKATRNWLRNWKQGVAQLRDFHDARQVSSRAGC